MNKREFLENSGLQMQVLEIWIEQEWIVPDDTPHGPQFDEIDVARAQLIHELSHKIGANDAGIDVILHLMDQLHSLRGMLDDLRREM